MTINEIIKVLDAECLAGKDGLEKTVTTACGSDMMSDVLAYTKNNACLITGLCNPQVVRTAEMLDVECVIFCRGKRPSDEMLAMADARDIVILSTPHRMFTTCGLLYEAGITGGES